MKYSTKPFHLHIISLFLILIMSQLSAQKLEFESIGAGLGYFRSSYRHNDSQDFGGLSYALTLQSRISKNIFAFQMVAGEDLRIYGSSSMNFLELNFLYGREIPLSKIFYAEPFIGLGYFRLKDKITYIYNSEITNPATYNKFAVPVQLNIGVKTSKHWRLGIASAYNFNSIAKHYEQQLYLKYYF